MLVRSDSLRTSMSEYLISELQHTPNVTIRRGVELTEGRGTDRLEAVTIRDRSSGNSEEIHTAALFVLIGGEPRTDWLEGVVERTAKGYILTGPDLLEDGRNPPGWPYRRPPLSLETSVPGIFAAGDVRYRSIKRVASAIGEGATAVHFIHRYLGQLRLAPVM